MCAVISPSSSDIQPQKKLSFSFAFFCASPLFDFLSITYALFLYPATKEFFIGGVAGMCAVAVAQPIDSLRTRFAAQGEPKVFQRVGTVNIEQKEAG